MNKLNDIPRGLALLQMKLELVHLHALLEVKRHRSNGDFLKCPFSGSFFRKYFPNYILDLMCNEIPPRSYLI